MQQDAIVISAWGQLQSTIRPKSTDQPKIYWCAYCPAACILYGIDIYIFWPT